LRHYLKPLLPHPELAPDTRDALLQKPELGIADEVPLPHYGEVARQILNLFSETAPDREFMAALPLTEAAQPDLSIAAIGAHCYRLELAMRTFARQLQEELNHILQRQTPQLQENAWSPAPGSHFLKELLTLDTRLAINPK
jgi:hypothetical protein